MLSQLKKEMPFLNELKKGRLIGGIELSSPDEAMMNYLKFITNKIAVKELSFVHVVPNVEFLAFDNPTSLELDETLIQPLQKTITQTFKGTKAEATRLMIRAGDPLDEILDEAEKEDAALIVIGQKEDGHHNITARKIARRAERSIWVIPEEADLSMNNILVPFDFSENAKDAFLIALDIREQVNPNAKITLVYVYELPNFSLYRVSRSADGILNDMKADRKEALDKFLTNLNLEDTYNIQTKIIEKNDSGIARYLLRYAKKDGADLIVMGAQGHSAVANFLIGSVTENLLTQNHKIPTLIVRSE